MREKNDWLSNRHTNKIKKGHYMLKKQEKVLFTLKLLLHTKGGGEREDFSTSDSNFSVNFHENH